MGGIVGPLAKSPAFQQQLGRHMAAMLAELSERRPDSVGLAVYRKPAAAG